jgi:hypothetical protein
VDLLIVTVYDPLTTIQLSIYQAWESLSLKGTIAKLNTTRALKKLTPISMNTGAFFRAKARLNEDLLKSLALKVNTSDKNFLWKNRHVKIVDGTTMMMEDTLENQSKFPQMSRQKKGLGQPILRALCIFSHSTGKILNIEFVLRVTKLGVTRPSNMAETIFKGLYPRIYWQVE